MVAQVHVGPGSHCGFKSFSMAKTAITSNRAVPGKICRQNINMHPKFKKKKKVFYPFFQENQQSLTIFKSPHFSLHIYIFLFFFILEQLCFVMTALATRAL